MESRRRVNRSAAARAIWVWPLFAVLLAPVCGAQEAVPPTEKDSSPKVEAAPEPANPPAIERARVAGEDWPQFLGPTADGRSGEVGIRTDWSKGLPILWKAEAGEGYGAPTTSEGRLFFFDRDGSEARLVARHAETGEILWSEGYETAYEDLYGYSNGPRASPLVDGPRVYTFGAGGRLRAHLVEDGKLLFDLDTEARYGVKQNFFGAGTTPVVEGDLLITMIGGSPPDSPGITGGTVTTNGTAVVAFDKLTGEERYRLGEDLASYAGLRLATIDGRRWGFAFVRGGLLGFHPTRGTLDFHFPWRAKAFESVNAATPVVVGDRLFLTETYGPGAVLLEIGEKDPKVLWKDQRRAHSLACHWNTPIYHEGYLYGSSGRHSGSATLRAIEMETGEVKWSEPGLERASLLFVDGHFVVLGERGQLDLIRATPEKFDRVATWMPRDEEGDPLLRYPAWNAPVLSHGVLYLRGKDLLLAAELIPASAAKAASAE